MVLKELLGRKEIRNGTTYFRNGVLVEMLRQPSYILFDENNSLTADKSFFLHELFGNGRLFLQATDEVIQKHPDCNLFMACNPCNARYSGTNKLNIALARRLALVLVPEFTTDEIRPMIDCGDKATTDSLLQYFEQSTKLIKEQTLRISFGLSTVRNIAEDIRDGDTIENAVAQNFFNQALLTASDKERETLKQLAVVCFGISAFEKAVKKARS
jgi:midasin